MEKQNQAFSQEFNFKEADEAPDDQLIMRGVYFNAFGASELQANNQAKKKLKKRPFANRFRDQLDQISKLKEQEMSEQVKVNNKNEVGNIQSGNNNNSGTAQMNSNLYNNSHNSESSDEDQKFISTHAIKPQQSHISNGGYQNAMIQNSSNIQAPQQKQQQPNQQIQSNRQKPNTANNMFETQNITSTYNNNNTYQNIQSKNTLSRSININVSNDSSSSDQEFQESYKQKNIQKISPIPENPQKKMGPQIPSSSQIPQKSQQITMQTQSKNIQKSSYQVGATCVQNKKNKKRNKSRMAGNQSLTSNLQINLQKKNKPFYKSSSSSEQEIDDDLEDEKGTFTQQFINPYRNQNISSSYQNNPYQFQQKPNYNNQFRQQQQQQQRSQEQNDTSDLSPCIQPKNLNLQNFNNIEYNQQLLDSSIQSVSIKKNIKNSSQSMSTESDIEEDQNKNRLLNNDRKMNTLYNQMSNSSQSLLKNNNKVSNLKIGGSANDYQNQFISNNNNNNLQYHINAANNFGNNLQNYQNNYCDRKLTAQSPSKQLGDSGIKRNSLAVNSAFNKTTDFNNNGSNYKSSSKEDYYQKEKLIKSIEGEQSIITVKIENINLKPFQTAIAEIISVERLNPQFISYTLKPSQIIHAILKQQYTLQYNTLQVGKEYIFKFHTLESSGNFPIINVNEYIPK